MKSYTKKASDFYHSSAWIKCQKAYKAYKHGICERCGSPNGQIVHHKEYLNNKRLDDPNYTLNWDNLELLCIDCHNKEHFTRYSPTAEGLKFDENGNLTKTENTEKAHSRGITD